MPPNDSSTATARQTRNGPTLPGAIEANPSTPAAPSVTAWTCQAARSAADTAVAPTAIRKGTRSRRVTPNIAGSAIPRAAGAVAVAARARRRVPRRALSHTARDAAACATFAAAAMGKMNDPPVDNRPNSIAINPWWSPVTTSGE